MPYVVLFHWGLPRLPYGMMLQFYSIRVKFSLEAGLFNQGRKHYFTGVANASVTLW
jgi:hypothetical protein